MIKRILLVVALTFFVSNASAQLIRVTVNGVYDGDVVSSSYAEPDTSIFYTFVFDTLDATFRIDRIQTSLVSITYRLGSGPLTTFESNAFFTASVLGVFQAPISPTSTSQLNINTNTPLFFGPTSDFNFNTGTVDTDFGFYSNSRFRGQYQIAMAVPAPETFTLLLLSTLALVFSQRMRRR